MLTKKEKKLIQHYYVYPTIILAAIAIDLLIGFFWAFLVMLDDMAFNSVSLYARSDCIPGNRGSLPCNNHCTVCKSPFSLEKAELDSANEQSRFAYGGT